MNLIKTSKHDRVTSFVFFFHLRQSLIVMAGLKIFTHIGILYPGVIYLIANQSTIPGQSNGTQLFDMKTNQIA